MKILAVITIVFLLLVSCKEYSKVISLEGSWQFALDSTDVGISQEWYKKDFNDKIALPGTTDEAGKGVPNLLTHTNWQWWSLLKQSKTMVLDSIGTVVPLVEVVDNFLANKRLSNMFEAKSGEGKLIFCSMDLLSDWDKRPDARQLYYSLLEYMKSEDFNPSYNITDAEILSLITKH